MQNTILKYIPRVIVAFVLLQTLLFKFGIGGEEYLKESKMLFSSLANATLGSDQYEVFLRIGTGILELIASILILVPRSSLFGAILACGLMFGAILSHVFFIGISINGDGGQLMLMAILVLACSLWVLWKEKSRLSQ